MNWLTIQQIALLNGRHSQDALFAAQLKRSDKLRSALKLASTRIGLLSRHGSYKEPVTLADGPKAFCVQLAESSEDFSECFQLRRRIYGLLGYLPSHVVQSTEPWEMDFYDLNALHFLARDPQTGRVAGMIRLVLPQRIKSFLSGGAGHDPLRAQKELVRRLAQNIQTEAYKRALRLGKILPLPCLGNTLPTKEWMGIFELALEGGELSRLIVEPAYRGAGLSQMLVHAALSAALDLGRRVILGECLPLHVPMYEKLGFQEIEGRVASPEALNSYPFSPQTLLFSLETGKQVEHLRWITELFKMATKDLERSELIRKCP
jgi:GNAT superfamily N-acetyltransferase